jgi:hypothetical protein
LFVVIRWSMSVSDNNVLIVDRVIVAGVACRVQREVKSKCDVVSRCIPAPNSVLKIYLRQRCILYCSVVILKFQ